MDFPPPNMNQPVNLTTQHGPGGVLSCLEVWVVLLITLIGEGFRGKVRSPSGQIVSEHICIVLSVDLTFSLLWSLIWMSFPTGPPHLLLASGVNRSAVTRASVSNAGLCLRAGPIMSFSFQSFPGDQRTARQIPA